MPTLQPLDCERFRRELAGVEDYRNTAVMSNDVMRQKAVELVVASAIAFNREKLDPMTLWTRIDSAIQRGVAAASGGDIEALVNTMFDHLQTEPNVAVSEDIQIVLGPVMALDADAAYALLKYLGTYRFTALAAGRAAWETRKAARKNGGAE